MSRRRGRRRSPSSGRFPIVQFVFRALWWEETDWEWVLKDGCGVVGVCSPAGACIRHGRSGHSSDATPSDMYFGFVPCLSPFLLISLSIALPHDLYISYSFAPDEELGIYAYPSVSTLRWTAAVCCRTDHRWEIPVPWQQTHICSIVSPSRALCGSDHSSFHQRAANQRAYIDSVDIFIILTKALKYVNPLYFS